MILLFSDPTSEREEDVVVDALWAAECGLGLDWIRCKKRSKAWNYFLIDKQKRDRVKCKKCPTILRYSSSTSDMLRHAKSHSRSRIEV